MSTAHKRDRHGQNRGLPPPATFDLDVLPASTLLTECEAAAAARFSRNTLQAWRRLPDHPLCWTVVGAGHVRYRVGDLKRFLAMGQPRKRNKPPPAAEAPELAPPRRRARRAKADDVPATQEQA